MIPSSCLATSTCLLGYVPEWQIDIYLRYIVPNVMKKHRKCSQFVAGKKEKS